MRASPPPRLPGSPYKKLVCTPPVPVPSVHRLSLPHAALAGMMSNYIVRSGLRVSRPMVSCMLDFG